MGMAAAQSGTPQVNFRGLRALIAILLIVAFGLLVSGWLLADDKLVVASVGISVCTALLALVIQRRVRIPVRTPAGSGSTGGIGDAFSLFAGDTRGEAPTAVTLRSQESARSGAPPSETPVAAAVEQLLKLIPTLTSVQRDELRAAEKAGAARPQVIARLDQADLEEQVWRRLQQPQSDEGRMASNPTRTAGSASAYADPAVGPEQSITDVAATTPASGRSASTTPAFSTSAEQDPRKPPKRKKSGGPRKSLGLPADPGPVGEVFPIADYDSLRAHEVLERLASLTPLQLELVAARERQGQARTTVLRRIDQLLLTGGM